MVGSCCSIHTHRIVMKERNFYSQKGSQKRVVYKKENSRIHNKKEMKLSVQIKEIGGPVGPEPTRFGDWEKKGRCIDF